MRLPFSYSLTLLTLTLTTATLATTMNNTTTNSTSTSPSDLLASTHRKLIIANHILDHYSIVDGFGFVAARNPLNPSTYFIARQDAPALISSPADLIEHHVSDSSPVDPTAAKSYSERFIMGELFRRFPQVNAAVHSHSLDVLPFCVVDSSGEDGKNGSGQPVKLSMAYHMGGFLGNEVPVWDVRPLYSGEPEDHPWDMLVNDQRLGASLAGRFSEAPNGTNSLDHTVVLMAKHGYAVQGPDIETVVFRAVYTAYNARVQKETMALQGGKAPALIDQKVVEDCKGMNEWSQFKSWNLWSRVVEVNPLYRLEM